MGSHWVNWVGIVLFFRGGVSTQNIFSPLFCLLAVETPSDISFLVAHAEMASNTEHDLGTLFGALVCCQLPSPSFNNFANVSAEGHV